jgi:pSer/pThr/pTyr-binding forkhead associated (FHA) protein
MGVHMCVVLGRPQGKWLYFPPGEYLIGHGPECHVRTAGPHVSRQHCLVRVVAGAARVQDLGSAAGTLVNGTLVRGERPLADGDQLQLGPLALLVSAAGPARAKAA